MHIDYIDYCRCAFYYIDDNLDGALDLVPAKDLLYQAPNLTYFYFNLTKNLKVFNDADNKSNLFTFMLIKLF